MAAQVKVDTSFYERVWGRKPQGTRLWAFGAGGGVTYQEEEFYGPYAEAVKKAIEWAQRYGRTSIQVYS